MDYQKQSPEIPTTKCLYHLKNAVNPHKHEKFEPNRRKLICDSVLDTIGNTPMIRINKIPKQEGVECEILAKCEFFNPSGSMKDRIALRMIEDAERTGKLTPETQLYEPTSGNTGIALAMVSAVKNYKLAVCMSEKMSTEKQDVMTGLGAKVIRTPGECGYHDPSSLYQQCKRLNMENPNSLVLDQYTNPNNALAHYDQTGEEIWYQCEGKVDVIVVGTGTAGTISGIGRKIKEKNPDVKIIAVDPYGSVLAMPQQLNQHKEPHDVEGIGKDFIPRNLDRNIIDEWFKIGNLDGQPMARRLVREEGLFCGGSSGALLSVAIKYAKRENLGPDKRIVCLFADSIRNYISKFLQTEWMVEKGLMKPQELVAPTHPLRSKPLEEVNFKLVKYYTPQLTVGETLEIFKNTDVQNIPIVENQKIVAVVTSQKLMDYILNKNLQSSDLVFRVWSKDFSAVWWHECDLAAVEQLLVRRTEVFLMKTTDDNGLEVYSATQKDIIKTLSI